MLSRYIRTGSDSRHVSCLTLRYWQPDVVVDHVLRGAGVVAGVLEPGVGDGEPDHGGVGGGHPQRVRVRPRHCGGDRHPGPAISRSVGHMVRCHQTSDKFTEMQSLFHCFYVLEFCFSHFILCWKLNGTKRLKVLQIWQHGSFHCFTCSWSWCCCDTRRRTAGPAPCPWARRWWSRWPRGWRASPATPGWRPRACWPTATRSGSSPRRRSRPEVD